MVFQRIIFLVTALYFTIWIYNILFGHSIFVGNCPFYFFIFLNLFVSASTYNAELTYFWQASLNTSLVLPLSCISGIRKMG